MRLSDREVALLRVLVQDGVEQERGLFAGRAGILAGFVRYGRTDAGATRTLDAMYRKGLTRWEYGFSEVFGSDTARRWWVTEKGRLALGEYVFGEG